MGPELKVFPNIHVFVLLTLTLTFNFQMFIILNNDSALMLSGVN